RLLHKMLSLDDGDGLNRWWVWRKGLAGFDFFEHQLRLLVTVDCRPHLGKASAVERRGAERVKRAPMLGRAIAPVSLPAVARIFARIVGHDSVACDLGEDRRRGDRA